MYEKEQSLKASSVKFTVLPVRNLQAELSCKDEIMSAVLQILRIKHKFCSLPLVLHISLSCSHSASNVNSLLFFFA